MNNEILMDIGLSNYEAQIYTVLLAQNQVSAYELAKKAGLYKQVVYDTLKRLEEKGFVSSVLDGRTKKFKATPPGLILEFLNERVENYKHILPQLNNINNAAKQEISVETYKGKNIVRIALRDILRLLKEGEEVLCTAVDELYAMEHNKAVIEQYERDLIKRKITERIIIEQGKKGLFKKSTTTYKKIPSKYYNPNPVLIYGDNVQTLVWGNPCYLIIIRNKNVADSYRKQFELMWNTAK